MRHWFSTVARGTLRGWGLLLPAELAQGTIRELTSVGADQVVFAINHSLFGPPVGAGRGPGGPASEALRKGALEVRVDGGAAVSFPGGQLTNTPFVLPDGRAVLWLTTYVKTYLHSIAIDDRLSLIQDGRTVWMRPSTFTAPRIGETGQEDGGLWLDSDGRHLWMRTYRSVGLVNLASGEEVKVTTDRVQPPTFPRPSTQAR